MRRPTFHLLSATFTLAVAACKKEPLPEPPPPLPSTATAPQPPAVTTTTIRQNPGERKYGQRCGGELVAGLSPTQAVDYLELRLDYYPDRNKHEIVVAGSKGEACANAKDKSVCEKSLSVAKAEKSGQYLVFVRGDEVSTVTGKATAAFLAPIESGEEAAFTLVQTMAESTSAAAILPSCAPHEYRQTNDGWETTHTLEGMCEAKTVTTYLVTKTGEVKTLGTKQTPPKPGCDPNPRRGRRPEGFALESRGDAATLGGHFAECAELEAASVDAFRRLDDELRAAGAPESLRRRSRRAAQDEARHTTTMTALAERFGGAPRAFVVEPQPARSLAEMAIENAVEGCVFETWAALLATWQAVHAGDPEVRAAMKTIARDETRHAALAWDVAAFLDARLTRGEVARVRVARDGAFARLEEMITAPPSKKLRTFAGLPTAREARALFEQLLEVVDDAAAAA